MMTSVAMVDDHELLRSGLAGLINSFPEYKVLFEAEHGHHSYAEKRGKGLYTEGEQTRDI